MRLLILGGTGFLSSAVTEVCLEAGHEVTVFTRGRRPVPPGVTALVGDRAEGAEFVQRFADSEYDGVLDCICYTEADARADLEAFAGRIGHLVMISTDFVYGAERSLPITEECATAALSEYGRQKVHAEGAFRDAWESSRFPATALRPPHIMGARGQLGSGSLAGRNPMLLSRLEQGAPTFLLDGGALLIQPVLHRDIARAALATLGKPQCFGQVYNCAGPEAVTTRRYYELIAELLEVELQVAHLPSAVYLAAYPDRAPFVQHRMYDVSALRRDAGYAPETPVDHCIYEMVDWLQGSEATQPYSQSARETALLAALQQGEEAALAALREAS